MAEALLLTVVTLGLPVIALFGAGYAVHRYRAGLEGFLAAADVDWRGEPALGGPCRAAPCWQIRACPLAARDVCPAYDRTYLPCWLARKLASGGHLREQCLSCALYRPEQAILGTPRAAPSGGGVSAALTAGAGK